MKTYFLFFIIYLPFLLKCESEGGITKTDKPVKPKSRIEIISNPENYINQVDQFVLDIQSLSINDCNNWKSYDSNLRVDLLEKTSNKLAEILKPEKLCGLKIKIKELSFKKTDWENAINFKFRADTNLSLINEENIKEKEIIILEPDLDAGQIQKNDIKSLIGSIEKSWKIKIAGENQKTRGLSLKSNQPKLITFDQSSFKLLSNDVLSIKKADESSFFIGFRNAGLALLNSDGFKVLETETISKKFESVYAIESKNRKEFYIGTDFGIYYSNNGTWKLISEENSSLSANYVISLLLDQKNRLFAGTYKGLNIIENENVTNVFDDQNTLPSLSVKCMAEGLDKKVYIGSDNGIYSISKDLEIELFNRGPSLNKQIKSCFRSFMGELYFLDENKNLYFFEKDEIKSADFFPAQENKRVKAINEDRYGRLWLSKEEGGLKIYGSGNWFKPSNEELRNPEIKIDKIAAAENALLFYDGENLYFYGY